VLSAPSSIRWPQNAESLPHAPTCRQSALPKVRDRALLLLAECEGGCPADFRTSCACDRQNRSTRSGTSSAKARRESEEPCSAASATTADGVLRASRTVIQVEDRGVPHDVATIFFGPVSSLSSIRINNGGTLALVESARPPTAHGASVFAQDARFGGWPEAYAALALLRARQLLSAELSRRGADRGQRRSRRTASVTRPGGHSAASEPLDQRPGRHRKTLCRRANPWYPSSWLSLDRRPRWCGRWRCIFSCCVASLVIGSFTQPSSRLYEIGPHARQHIRSLPRGARVCAVGRHRLSRRTLRSSKKHRSRGWSNRTSVLGDGSCSYYRHETSATYGYVVQRIGPPTPPTPRFGKCTTSTCGQHLLTSRHHSMGRSRSALWRVSSPLESSLTTAARWAPPAYNPVRHKTTRPRPASSGCVIRETWSGFRQARRQILNIPVPHNRKTPLRSAGRAIGHTSPSGGVQSYDASPTLHAVTAFMLRPSVALCLAHCLSLPPVRGNGVRAERECCKRHTHNTVALGWGNMAVREAIAFCGGVPSQRVLSLRSPTSAQHRRLSYVCRLSFPVWGRQFLPVLRPLSASSPGPSMMTRGRLGVASGLWSRGSWVRPI